MNHCKFHISARPVCCLGIAAAAALTLSACTRDIDTDVQPEYPDIADVFIDGFAADMQYQAWGKVTNFHVDTDEKYSGTAAMRIEIPSTDDPLGTWAGGNFYSTMGRNLTRYDALTFWARSSVATTLEAGFGNGGDNTDYLVGAGDLKVNTTWQQYIIPIPNAAKLVKEKGLFYYSAGQVNKDGYNLWIDDVKFEHLGLLAHPLIASSVRAGFPGNVALGQLTEKVNLPNGVDRVLTVSPKYFDFESSNPDVAAVDGDTVHVYKSGTAVLTTRQATGSITLKCYDYAPMPTAPQRDVISILSSAYKSGIQVNWNPYWQYSTAEYTDINTGNRHVAQYSNLNFVGIVFSETKDCADMNYLHFDFMSMDDVTSASSLTMAVHNGSENPEFKVTPQSYPSFVQGRWTSVDVPLTALAGNKKITQLVVSCEGIRNVVFDNIYFHK